MDKPKDYFFLLDLKKPNSEDANDKVEFTNPADKDSQPKCIKTKEENDKIVKIFKFSHKLSKNPKPSFEFFFNGKKYKLNIENIKEKTFIFDVSLLIHNAKIEQGKISLAEKMNYFYEALISQNENKKLTTLYLDSINLCKKKLNFDFLINIFIKVQKTNLCSKVLELFSQNTAKFVEKIKKESLQKYKFEFEQICENIDNGSSEISSNKIDFYGLILCYFNNFDKKYYKQLFDKLSENTNSENILLEVLFKYKNVFENQKDMNKELLTKIIQYCTKKPFQEFKEITLFYLKDINTLLEILEENKEEIIKIKGFEPIEIPEIKDDEKIKFGIVNPKIEKIINFSKSKKKLFFILKLKFWKSLGKKCTEPNRDNIEISSTLRALFIMYYVSLTLILSEKDKIRNELKPAFKNGIFDHQIDKLIIEYINNNQNITNSEIIDLIKDYDKYYSEKQYVNKRDPEILNKIDLEEMDDNFIQKFKDMKFEKIFEIKLENFLLTFTNKIRKISDFDKIFKIININELGDKKKAFINQLKRKYNIAIKADINNLSESDENFIKSLVDLTIFMCLNEGNIDFLENTINKSKIINKKIKHKIYIEIIKFCKINKNEKIKNFIISIYIGELKQANLSEFIEFLVNLNENDANDFIENLDNKYYIIEKEFYAKGINLNIRLLNELLIVQKLDLKDDNKYKKSNIEILTKIVKDIEDKEIKFEYLSNFSNDEKDTVLKKLNILTLVKDIGVNPEEIYDNISKYYKEMNENLGKLSNYKDSLERYHSVIKKDAISNISRNIEAIKKDTYNYFDNNRRSELQDLFDESYDIVKIVNEVKNSKLFKVFYLNENQGSKKDKNDSTSPFDIAYAKYTEFKKSLIAEGPDSQKEFINKIKIKYEGDKIIQKELTSLISGEQQNEEEIMILFNGKIIERDLNAMFEFFNYFKNNEIINRELDKWKNKCKDFSNAEDTSKMKNILNELKKEGIYDYKKNNEAKSNYINFFNLFYESGQALNFLDKHTAVEIKPLIEKIDPNGSGLDMNDISDTINCVGFFQELKKIEGGMKEVIKNIQDNLDENDSIIFKRFKHYIEISKRVIELNENFDFSEQIYKDINEIIISSKFIFNKNNDEFDVFFKEGEENKYKVINFEDIKRLKNKIQIKQENKEEINYDINSNYWKKLKKLKFFKDLSINVEEIYEVMNILRTKGSTLPISISVDISYPDVNYYLGQDGKKKEYKDIQNFLSSAKRNIIKKLNSVYKQMTTIRFLYGKQIDSILSHIQGSTNIDSFLRYILNFTDPKDIKKGKKVFARKYKDYINETNNYNNDSFNIIHDYILSLFNENKLPLEKHYKNIAIKEKGLKGIYRYFSEADSLEEDILQIFLDKVGKIPIAQNILISSKETSYEEMQAFFHRAILCEENTLFVVELNGSFSSYQQRSMNNFIDKILTFKNAGYNQKNEDNQVDKSDTSSYMESCLLFIYNKNSESFLNELKQYNPKEFKMPEGLAINSILINNNPRNSFSSVSTIFSPLKEELYRRTHIVQSEICGLGKSTQIKNRIKKSDKIYIYFPLGGNITKDVIYKKLKDIMNDINSKTKNNYEDIAIHLDIFDSKESIISILNEFLFSFLITKFYSSNENVIFIPTNIEIYIEIPNSFKDFIGHYGILKFFKKDDDIITIEHLPELDLPEDKINLFKNMLGISDNKKIYKWLKEKIKIERYSYHQIHIFINLFICQYNIFKGQKIYFSEGGKDVTDKCIDSFAEATKYFTYGGFSKLLLEKEDNKNTIKDEVDILSQEYDNDLKNEKFDKKLIFIVENKNEKFGKYLKGIYYNLDISTEALKNGEALGKLSEEEKEERKRKKEEMNPETFEKFEFLKILKKILDLDNPVKTKNKIKKDKKLKSLQEIIEEDEYVMTIDNFRKMILILYRIIANIPVILMGETGCGKTALIKKLNKLLNNGKETLVTINIEPSYDDKKITKKMNEINKMAEQCKGEDELLWVFFDELNTCDSLSLITEIFINRTFGRKELAKNIRLIGACNPYRKKKENKNICGLTYQNDNNEVPLVYLVNILPQSLMYYVFNFGSLEKENEDQYISSIISDIIPDKELKEATKNVISKCHDYLRKTFDSSIVSLREMKRFKKIYKFLIEYFENKEKVKPSKCGKKELIESTKLKSIIMSVYLCYYIRLVDETTRTKFDGDLQEEFKKLANYKFVFKNQENYDENEIIHDDDLKNDLKFNYNITDFTQFHFSQILSLEQDFILENVSLNKGIGKNKSLKENIFLLFTALVTNIPLIIIGKPGSSKSLSAQLINKEMEGKFSRKKFFKYYPSIIQTYFQGSDSTTPKDVEDVFIKAEGRLEGLKKSNVNDLPISMILFDELGLAERSKYNPLKALHSHLELDGNNKGISFVGISNWTLDAAKINRALTLSVPDLDSNFDDLKVTSVSIAESINDSFGSNKIFNKILPNVYLLFKENLKILKNLTVYKKYELQEYKYLIDKYKDDEDFQKIFSDIGECKSFFDKKENKKEEKDFKIYEYDILKKIKKKLKIFREEKEGENIKKKNKNNNSKDNNNESEEKTTLFDNEDFKMLYEKDKIIKEDFLGNRDFYYIIKGIANEMDDNNTDIKAIIKRHIERNFGGFDITIDFEEDYNSLKEFQKYDDEIHKNFFKKIKENKKENKTLSSVQIFEIIFNIYCLANDESDSMIDEANLGDFKYMKNIIENIKDIKSRYLLIGINSYLASLIHQKISKELNKYIYFYEGSPFPNDNNEEYQFKIINIIQKHGENGDIIILHNLNQVYAFLYDLFNKNFIIKDGKQYARICLGNYSEQHTPINRSFRVIVMVDKNYLDKVEPPFLNRFEKMILSFSQLIDDKQKKIAEIISFELDMKKYEYKINYRLKNLLIGCHKTHLLAMINYEIGSDEKNIKNEKTIIENIFNKIYKLLPQDIIVNLDNKNRLKELYNSKKKYYNLEQYLNNKPSHKISIIYTFNDINAVIKCIDESSSFKMISEIESENQLLRNIENMITEKDEDKKKQKRK